MTVDRWTRRFLRGLDDQSAKPGRLSTPLEFRELHREVMASNGPGPAMHQVLDRTVEGPDGGPVPVRVFVPIPDPRGVVVYYHGGGWVAGSIVEAETIVRKLAERTSCAFVLADYRLAPEHPYPAAIDDSYAVLRWASERVREIARNDVPLMVAGDDAGGNLAAAVALRARDEDGPRVDMQILICPILDADVAYSGDEEVADRAWFGPVAMRWFWDQYVPDPADRSEPYAAPLRARDVSGLPAAVVVTAEHSRARAAAEAYADRLRQAGVVVDSHCYADQMHGFFMLLSLPLGERAFQQIVNAVRAHCVRASRAPNLLAAGTGGGHATAREVSED